MQDFSSKLIPAPDQLPPHIFLIAGLSGIGRRTFAQHALQSRLSMRIGPIFHLRKTDGLDALHLALLTEGYPLAKKEELSEKIANFTTADITSKAAEIVHLLTLVSDGNVAPIIVDEGAFLQSDGAFTEETIAILKLLSPATETVVILIQTRLPLIKQSDLTQLSICTVRIPPLDTEASRQLLSKRLRDSKVSSTSEQVSELIPFLNGYPPAINLAAAYAKDYSLGLLLQDKSTLINFQQQTFAQILEELKLNGEFFVCLLPVLN